MRYSVIVLSVIMVLLFLVSCNPKPDTYVVATVNGERIMLGEVMKGKAFESIVGEEVNKAKLSQWAKIKNIKVDQAKVNAKYDIERKKVGSEKEWVEFLKVRGLTVDSAKKILYNMELQYALALSKSKPITDETIEKEWKKSQSWWQSVVSNDLKGTTGINKDPKTITYAEAKPVMKKTLEDQAAQAGFPDVMKEMDEYFKKDGKIVYNYLPLEERQRKAREEKEQEEMMKKQQRDMEQRQRQVTEKGENIKAETGGGGAENQNPQEPKKEEPKTK